MKAGGSLQRRLAIGLAFAVTLMWLLATLWAALALRHELDEAFDESLEAAARQILPLAAHYAASGQGGETRLPLSDHDDDDDDDDLVYRVRDASGRVLLLSARADRGLFPDAPFRGFRETKGHRLYGLSAKGGLFVEVAEPLEHRREAMLDAIAVLFYPLLLLLPLSLFGAWWFTRRSLRPLRLFRDDIEARGGADLSPLQPHDVPAELAPLATAMNHLLGRMQSTLQAERSFTANSAHELRTPIAAALAQTQRLLAEAPQGILKERARRIESALHDLAQLSEKLMQLAKAEGGGLLAEEPQDLSPVLDHVIDDLRRHGDQRPIRLERREDASLVSHMDADAFAILIRNLIENALKHGTPGAPVDIEIRDAGRISVANSGPLVPTEDLARLKGRFERGATDAEGSGLGLAIADAIATAAGGSLHLASPAQGRKDGFEALVILT